MGKNEDFGVVVCNGRFRVFKNGEIFKIKGGSSQKLKSVIPVIIQQFSTEEHFLSTS